MRRSRLIFPHQWESSPRNFHDRTSNIHFYADSSRRTASDQASTNFYIYTQSFLLVRCVKRHPLTHSPLHGLVISLQPSPCSPCNQCRSSCWDYRHCHDVMYVHCVSRSYTAADLCSPGAGRHPPRAEFTVIQDLLPPVDGSYQGAEKAAVSGPIVGEVSPPIILNPIPC